MEVLAEIRQERLEKANNSRWESLISNRFLRAACPERSRTGSKRQALLPYKSEKSVKSVKSVAKLRKFTWQIIFARIQYWVNMEVRIVNGEWRSGGWYQQIGGSGRRVNRSPHEITSTDFSIIGGVSHGEKNRQMRPIMRKNRKKARKSTRNLIACCAKQIQIPLCALCSLWLSEKTKPIWSARIQDTGHRIQNEKTKPI